MARRHASNSADVEEIAQEALIRAWRHRASAQDPARRIGWLSQIVRNEAARYWSCHRELVVWSEQVVEADPDPALSAAPARMDIRAALARLNRRDRLLLLLRYEVDLTQPRIAELLGAPEGTVKVWLHRARVNLKGELDDL